MESNIPESRSNTHFFKDPIRKGHAIFYLVPYADNKLEQDFLENFIFLNPETIPKKIYINRKKRTANNPTPLLTKPLCNPPLKKEMKSQKGKHLCYKHTKRKDDS